MARYIDADKLCEGLREMSSVQYPNKQNTILGVVSTIENTPTTDVVEVKKISEQIIRKKAEVSDYWQNDVKRYRAMQGYSDIEHDTDNFLRGYNEAVEDILAIIDGGKKE